MEKNKKRLFIAIILNLAIVFLQVWFGLYSNSLALITDALHNFQDVISLIIAFFAIIYMQKQPTEYMTYGYLRSEVMAGFVNSAILVVAIFIIILSSVDKIFHPQKLESFYVILIGFIAFIINAFSAYLLGIKHSHNHHEDLNIRAAYLHLLSDAGMSLIVTVEGIIIYFYGIYWIDPVISIIFSIYILKETFPILKRSYLILMESTPPNISIANIKKEILSLDHIKDIHDVHVWALSSKNIYFTGHIILKENLSIEEFDEILRKITLLLKRKGINHITIQPETEKYKCENVY